MKTLILSIMCIIILGSQGQGIAQENDLQLRFQKAKRLITINCGDCKGGTKKGLEEGVAELLNVMELGYKNELEANKLLAEAYNEMATVYSVPDSEEQKKIINAYKKTYQKLVQLAPNDTHILYEYALTLDDQDLQLNTYKKIVKIAPDHIDARFAMSKILIEKGKNKEGISELNETLRRAKGQNLHNYKKRAMEVLEEHGFKEEKDKIEKQYPDKK